MTMPLKTELPVTNANALRAFWELFGAARARDALESHKGITAPGFALAVALVDAELAEARAQNSIEMLREIARAGYDIGAVTRVSSTVKDQRVVVEVTMPDAADAEV